MVNRKSITYCLFDFWNWSFLVFFIKGQNWPNSLKFRCSLVLNIMNFPLIRNALGTSWFSKIMEKKTFLKVVDLFSLSNHCLSLDISVIVFCTTKTSINKECFYRKRCWNLWRGFVFVVYVIINLPTSLLWFLTRATFKVFYPNKVALSQGVVKINPMVEDIYTQQSISLFCH